MKPENLPRDVKVANARYQPAKAPAAYSVNETEQHSNHYNNQHNGSQKLHKNSSTAGKAGLNDAQQQFILKFCRQLASVIQACDQSESAEIEVGRRLVGTQQIKVKLSARREN